MKPRRIQRSRLPGHTAPRNAFYVGRPTVFGNPWKVGEPGELLVTRTSSPIILNFALAPIDAVQLYTDWIHGRLQADEHGLADHPRFGRIVVPSGLEQLLLSLPLIRGRDLSCWCRPKEPCHVDPLMELANR